MLMPKRVKYRRVHRGRLKGQAMRGNFVSHGPEIVDKLLGKNVIM